MATTSNSCGCQDIAPCTDQIPSGCTPPLTVASGVKVYVVDDQGCAKLLSAPTQNSVLQFVGGTVVWRDGSTTYPISLPAIEDSTYGATSVQNRFAIFDSSGNLQSITTDPAVSGTRVLVLNSSGIANKDLVADLFPAGAGIIYRTGDTLNYITVPTTADTYLHWNGTAYEWATLTFPTVQNRSSYSGLTLGWNTNSSISGSLSSVVLVGTTSSVVFTNQTLSASTSASGAGGLDTGVVASSTWYYVWGISDGSNFYLLLSTSATTPIMPSGFTYKILLGSFYVNGSSNIDYYRQVDRQVWVATTTTPVLTITANQLLPASFSFATIVSPIARAAQGYLDTILNNSNVSVTIGADSNLVGGHSMAGVIATSGVVMQYSTLFNSAMSSPATLFYTSGSLGTWNSPTGYNLAKVYITGYTI